LAVIVVPALPDARYITGRLMRIESLNGLGLVAALLACWPGSALAQSGSAAAGAATFRLNCRPCHSDVAGRHAIGPSLAGVAGRQAGTSPNYSYSPAMQHSGVIWTDTDIAEFLAAPAAKVPGTKMSFSGLADADKRADLIAFLKTLRPATK
jgi:cytochrome c